MLTHVGSLFQVFYTVVDIFCFTLLLPFAVLLVFALMEYCFHTKKTARKLLENWKTTLINHPYKDLPEFTLDRLSRIKQAIYGYFSRRRNQLILLIILVCLLNMIVGYRMNLSGHAHIISHWAAIGIWIGFAVGKKFRNVYAWLHRVNIFRRNKVIMLFGSFIFGILAWFCVRTFLIGPWMLGSVHLGLGYGQGLCAGAYTGLILGLRPRLPVRAGTWFGLLGGLLAGYFLQEETIAILVGLCFWRSFHELPVQGYHIGWSVLVQPFLLVLLSEVLYFRFSRAPVAGAALVTLSFFVSALLLFAGSLTGNQPPADPLNSLNMSNACFDFISFIIVDYSLGIRKKTVSGWQVVLFGSSLIAFNYLLACTSLWLGLIPRIDSLGSTVLSTDNIPLFSVVWTPESPYFLISNSVLLPTMLIILFLSFLVLSKFVINVIVDRLEKLIIINRANCFERLILFCCICLGLISLLHQSVFYIVDSAGFLITGHHVRPMAFWLFLSHGLWEPSAGLLSWVIGLQKVLNR